MTNLTREDIVEAAKRAAAERGATLLSRNDFERLTSIGQYHIYRLFPEGGWSEVVQLAGLDHNPHHNLPISDDDLLAGLHEVVIQLGRFPTSAQFNARASASATTLCKRFQSWSGTKDRYRQWLEQRDPASPRLSQLQPAPRSSEVVLPASIEAARPRPT